MDQGAARGGMRADGPASPLPYPNPFARNSDVPGPRRFGKRKGVALAGVGYLGWPIGRGTPLTRMAPVPSAMMSHASPPSGSARP